MFAFLRCSIDASFYRGAFTIPNLQKFLRVRQDLKNKDVLGVAKKLLRVLILGTHWQMNAPLIKRLEAREPSLSIVIAAEVSVQTQKLGNVRGRLAKKSEVASVVWILFQRL